MHNLVVKNNTDINSMIHEIRGVEVILDSDLAKLFNVETKRINEAVSRNKEKFPERFSWVLKDNEESILRSQIATSNTSLSRGGRRYKVRVFTEHGVTMLATILRSKEAIEQSIKIIDAFVEMRRYLSNSLLEQNYINRLVLSHDKRISLVEDALDSFKEKNNHLFFDGQFYDAYSLMVDILNKSKKEIIVIDNYIDKNTLDIMKNFDRKILIVTNKYNNSDYEKYKSQYDNITFKIENSIHDRYLIIDRKLLYHCGASFKDLAKRCFSLNKIDDMEILNSLLNRYNI